MIAVPILAISFLLSTTWGIYLVYTIWDFQAVRRRTDDERKGAVVASLRRVVVAGCLWLICVSYVFRAACVLVGVGNEVAGQITFFGLLAANVAGSVFAVISLRFD